MSRQCTHPKKRRDASWFKEKVLIVQAHAKDKELDEEQLAFLADPKVADGQVSQTITHNADFQIDDLDAYDSYCDDISSAKAIHMSNLLICDLDVIFEVVQIVLWYLDSECSKHMTENRSQLANFVNKFLTTIKFGNNQIAKIMGYGDCQIRNVTISRVYYIEGLGHNLFSVGQLCDLDLKVAFHKHTCFVHNLEGVDLLMGSQATNLYALSIGDMMKSSPIYLLLKASKTKSWLWHRRLSYLNFSTITQLANQGLVREAVDTTCYTQNFSLIRLRYEKTPYELLHDRKPDISYLRVFGKLCHPTNDSVDLGKLIAKADVGIFIGYAPAMKAYHIYNSRTRQNMETIHVDFDELTAMDSEQISSGPVLQKMTPGILSLGLVPKPPSLKSFVPPTRNDWDTLFQPLFDEFFNPSPCVDHLVPEVAALKPVVLTGISTGIKEADHDIEVSHKNNNPYFGHLIPEPSSKESPSQANPTKKHLHPVKRIFQYLRGTIDIGLWYLKDSCIALTALVDADHASCQDTRRSTSGSMQLLGDRLISHHQGAMGVVEMYCVKTNYQLADIFTKALGQKRLAFLIDKLGMKSMSHETLKRLAEEEEE
nr:integrase, catalytic region, zinc finger, CCHC-type, peptidase aspartic, catalytic [Tanacetum cinerariifolium]